MGPAALPWPVRGGRRDYGSRGTAAIIAVAFHIAFLLLLILPLRPVAVRETPMLAPMQVTLIELPRGAHQDLMRRAITPRLSKPTLHLANTPTNVEIAIPVDILPPPQPSQLRAAVPPGTKDVEADAAPSGSSAGSAQSAGPPLLHQVPPVYSVASQRAHEQGTVTMRVLVDAHGVPSQIRLVQSSGFPRLDESALAAVKRYRYSPPPHAAGAAQSWATARVEFDLLRMSVPTSVIQYDALIAEQIALARHAGGGVTRRYYLETDEEVRRLADRLTASLARAGAGASPPPHSRSAPTPLEMLATQGAVKHMQFVGFADSGFDCGNPQVAVDPNAVRCMVFEAQQEHGSSYWLALVDHSQLQLNVPLRLHDLLIAVGTEPLSAGRLAR